VLRRLPGLPLARAIVEETVGGDVEDLVRELVRRADGDLIL